MACGNSAKMPSSFLTLVKEEPADITVAMEVSNIRQMPISIGRAAQSTTVIPEPQIQPLSLTQINSSNFQNISRGDIDPNFEPVSRGRSNTWPLPCPEGFIEGEEPGILEPSTSGEHSRAQGSIPNFMEAAGGAPKKNTSRRNPWGNMSYADLIAQAIMSSPEGRATLSQIYDWMVQNINYFKDKGDSNSSAGWKNSIRHNLSLHSRFMRMQNEGTGKSSWWVLNPDAKPGKSTRRRANTLEGCAGRLEKNKRGRSRKKIDTSLRNGLDAPVSPSEGPIDFYPASPSGPGLHSGFQLSPQDYRPRASSNASSCGRLSPIPAIEADMHDSQVPPVSPGVAGWGPDYWSASNHGHLHGQPPHLRGMLPHQEHYADQLVDSIGEGLNLGTRENWPPHNGMTQAMNGTNGDCMKMAAHSMHSHPMNGFLNHHHHQHPAFGSYEDFSRFCPPHHMNRGFQPPLHEKTNQQRHPLHFQLPAIQNVSPAHRLSPPNGAVEGPPSYPAPPPHHHSTPQNHIHGTTPPSHHSPPNGPSHQVLSPSSQSSPLSAPISTTSQPFSAPITTISQHHSPTGHHHHSPTGHHHDIQPSTSTAMLRVAFSHREASSCAHNVTHRLNGLGPTPHNPNGAVSDLADLDNFQGGLECNVEEILKHELQYDDPLNFEFPQNPNVAFAYGQAYGNPHANASAQLAGAAGPSSVVQCASIQAGNHWVR